MPETDLASPTFVDLHFGKVGLAPRLDPAANSPGRLPVPLRRARADDGALQSAARPPVDLSGTTPTLLPDLLRAVAHRARHAASDPFHVLDDNPFIMREWLIVSQVLHAAASTMERRFEALFFGQ